MKLIMMIVEAHCIDIKKEMSQYLREILLNDISNEIMFNDRGKQRTCITSSHMSFSRDIPFLVGNS